MKEYLRKCKVCGIEATTLQELSIFKTAKKSPYNRENYCKVCWNKREHEKRKSYYKTYMSTYKNNYLVKTYGITMEDYNRMLEAQNRVCKICGASRTSKKLSLVVDHCHTTGKVRGLLCDTCNRALGMFKDSTEYLKNAIHYLEQ